MDTVLNTSEILQRLPHRFPFMLVDRVISKTDGPNKDNRTGAKVVALKNVTFNEPFFPGHFPGMPVMPGVLQIEAMAQASILALLKDGDAERVFFIASISEAKFRKPVVPGDTMIMTAEIVKDRGSIIMIKAFSEVNGEVVSEVQLMAKMAPSSKRVT